MIVNVHHCAIATVDLDRMVDFYQSVMGFELVSRGSWDAGSARHDAMTQLSGSAAHMVMLRLGTTCLELFEYQSPRPRGNDPNRPVSDAGLTHMAFVTDDIDADYARMTQAGVRFHCAPNASGPLRATYGRDPEGNVFELLEITDRSHPFLSPA